MPTSILPTIGGANPFLARVWVVAAIFSSVAYGIEIVLAAMCIIALSKSSGQISQTIRIALTLFVIFLCLLGTAGVAFTLITLVVAFINPGDIVKSLKGNYFQIFVQPFGPLELIFVVLATWGLYGLMIWRCLILYQGISPRKRFVFLVFLTLLTLTSLVFGFMDLVTMAPGVPWPTLNMLTVFETTSYFVNASLSILVAGRILYLQRRLRKTFGKGYGAAYTRVMVVIIDSSLLTLIWDGLITVLGLLYRDTRAIHRIDEVSLIIVKLLLHMNIIAPILIILRVAQGKAERGVNQAGIGTDTRAKISNIRFPSNLHGSSENAIDAETGLIPENTTNSGTSMS